MFCAIVFGALQVTCCKLQNRLSKIAIDRKVILMLTRMAMAYDESDDIVVAVGFAVAVEIRYCPTLIPRRLPIGCPPCDRSICYRTL